MFDKMWATLDTLVPIQALKLNNIEPGKFLDRSRLGNSWCYWYWFRDNDEEWRRVDCGTSLMEVCCSGVHLRYSIS